MSFLRISRRTVAFIVTCLPADLSSWLLLLGATFLFISHSLRGWPVSSSNYFNAMIWAGSSRLMSLPIFAAGVMGYYLALVGCKRPARRLLDSVLLPAAASLLANLIVAFLWFRDAGQPASFVNQLLGAPQLWQLNVLRPLAVNLGTGFLFANLGFVLIAVFYVLLSWGRATLPIRLPAALFSDAPSLEGEHRRTMYFVWMMIAMVFLTLVPGIAFVFLWNWIFPHVTWSRTAWTFQLGLLSYAALLFVFIALAVGKCGRKMIPAMLRIPPASYLAIAALIPAVIAYVGPLVSYVHARVLWNAR